jgi:hypothetical protein
VTVTERWARTERRIQLMQQAKRHGEVCGWCGRSFNLHETVYLEIFRVGARLFRQGGATHRSVAFAPVGSECASPEFLTQTDGRSPERCARCARREFYRSTRGRRSQALCSGRCRSNLSSLAWAERVEQQRQAARTADSERWARTDSQIEQVLLAPEQGGFCGWCSRVFGPDYAAYYDRFLIGEAQHSTHGAVTHRTILFAPVGIECASPELIAETAGRTPAPCAQCSRGVFYLHARSHRQWVTCSRRCEQYLAMGRTARKKVVEVLGS